MTLITEFTQGYPQRELSPKQTNNKSTMMITPTTVRLLQIFTVAFLTIQLGAAPVCANSQEMLDDVALVEGNNNNDTPTDDLTSQLMDEVKRSWNSLQGSWGKRGDQSIPLADNYDIQVPEWTTSGLNEYNEHPEMMRYSMIYASSPKALAAAVAAAAADSTNNGDAVIEGADTPLNFEKRSWKNMNVAWGKRRSAVWNKFRGAWGKREPGWNNLKGMWGKRSTGDWKKLQSAWGKRSLQQ